ncbi:MAG: L-threonylcarbamoyladenylate synthase [Planctomycetota bacterium]
METIVLNLKDQRLYGKHIETAARALRAGELVAFPTETVYGLGAYRDDARAVECIYEAKQRPEDKRLTLMIADRDDIKRYVGDVSDTAAKLMDFFWPGPLGIIFPLSDGTDVSIRLPDNAVARDMIRMANIPVVTTSANISGYPPATDARQAFMYLGGKISLLLDGGSARLRSPSTMVRAEEDGGITVVRQGIITEASIRSCLEHGLVKV